MTSSPFYSNFALVQKTDTPPGSMVLFGERPKGFIMRQYETMVIIDAMISDEAIAAEIQKINDSIVANGEILRRDDWGKRKLAYQINKKTHGFYVIFYYKAETSVVSSLEKAFKLNDNILRWMTIEGYPMSEVVYDQNQVQGTEEITPIDAEDVEVE